MFIFPTLLILLVFAGAASFGLSLDAFGENDRGKSPGFEGFIGTIVFYSSTRRADVPGTSSARRSIFAPETQLIIRFRHLKNEDNTSNSPETL
ncbi:hypothetical protein L596_014691 [Steinernema carpocapsae]|uniref:Secreted protein n=1 Tax=Steinernema carpocapsae TaxID=34508 RepID=A0A4U5NDS7_STECR|nr:hypothetical protein L596_014691 [Steinernema carpocapsae]